MPSFKANQTNQRKEKNQDSERKHSQSFHQPESFRQQRLESNLASPHSPMNITQLQRSYGNRATRQWLEAHVQAGAPLQRKENKTGLPDSLKSGVENLSGLSLDDVNVHYNSSRPAELQALAYAQGTDIHVGPGQERHLPHEAWHVAQQKQGRVKPTLQMDDKVQINDEADLEKEADQMGEKAMQLKSDTTEVDSRDARIQSDVVQLRGENPHAQAGSHGGWDLTAHHIVAHSKLVDAFKKLSEEDKAEVLRHSIPATLTKSMLDNMKVVLEEDSDKARADLRERLVSTKSEDADDKTVSNIRLGDIRNSFFEWQGGNQYQGPNTSIRAEPTSSKDDIDYDGKYFGNLDSDTFDRLTGLGDKLDDESEKDHIKDNLKAILDITKNQIPNVFDASKWTEIDSLATLTGLASNLQLNREHILNYSFFKLGMDEIGVGKKYADITGGSGDYTYKGKKMELQVKGTSGYIPLAKAQTIVPTEESSKTLVALLEELNVPVTKESAKYVIPVDNDLITLVAGKKFKVKGYDDSIPYQKEAGGQIEAAKGLVDNKQMKVVKALKSLYAYCEESGMPTSSFLPKELYDSLQQGAVQ